MSFIFGGVTSMRNALQLIELPKNVSLLVKTAPLYTIEAISIHGKQAATKLVEQTFQTLKNCLTTCETV